MNTDIVKGNKLIAEFMGAEKSVGRTSKKDMYSFIKNIDFCEAILCQTKDGEYIFFIDQLLFHTSWDWLMPVVEKIEELGYQIWISKVSTSIHKNGDLSFNIVVSNNSRRDNCWQAIIKFITWYNQNKQL